MKNFNFILIKFFRNGLVALGSLFKWIWLTKSGRVFGSIPIVAGIVQISGVSVKDLFKNDTAVPTNITVQIADSLKPINASVIDTIKPVQPTYEINTGPHSPVVIAGGDVNQNFGVDNDESATKKIKSDSLKTKK